MENRITILPDDLVHKIAAGEVVERPASVVKELVENSLDAGASKITISLSAGGKRLIRVSDNGSGMSHQDALLSLERYATSKIRSNADLFRIASLGFRGEALSSIAAVSKMKLVTRPKETLAATQVIIEGGKIKQVTETGASPGTIVEVKNLFYNVPARYKFLKPSNIELGYITQYVSQLALAYPQVQISLYHQERLLIEAVSEDLLERIAELYGIDLVQQLLAVNHELDNLHLSGYISKPLLNRSSHSHQSSFINRRLVREPLIYRSVYEAYKPLLPKGRHPVWVLFLELDPGLVDVNVHPAKTQVRLYQPQQIRQLITEGINKALISVRATPEFVPHIPQRHDAIPEAAAAVPHQQQIKAALADYIDSRMFAEPLPIKHAGHPPLIPGTKPAKATVSETPLAANTQFFSNLMVIGHLNQTFIICQNQQELIIIDQHAAHEKVLYERLLDNLASGSVPSQQLLFHQTLELSPLETGIIQEHAALIAEIGFEVSAFGGKTFILTAAPAYLGAEEAPQALSDVITGLAQERIPDQGEIKAKLLAKIACHAAIKANQRLEPEEIKSLIGQLAQLKTPFCCPHGRPVLLRYSLSELNRQFQRNK